MIGAPNVYRFTVTDLNALIRDELRKQEQLFKKALATGKSDAVTKAHLKEMISMISNKFNAERNGTTK
jgi:hypothetical protein